MAKSRNKGGQRPRSVAQTSPPRPASLHGRLGLELPRTRLGWFAAVLALLGPTLFVLPSAETRPAFRFMDVLVVGAVGLGWLVTVAAGSFRSVLLRATVARRGTKRRGGSPADAESVPLFDRPDRVRLAGVLALALLCWSLLAALISPQPLLSVLGTYTSGNGWLLTAAFVGAWGIGMAAGAEMRPLLEALLLAAAALNAAISVIQAATDTGQIASRAPGMFANPVFLGGFLIAALWLAAHRMAQDWRWGFVAALLVAGIQASGSRFAALLLLVAVPAAIIPFGWRRASILAAFAVLGLVVGGFLAATGGQPSSTSRAAEGTAGGGFRPRLEMWTAGLHAIEDHPIQGAGPGRFVDAVAPYRTLRFAQTEGPEQYFEDAHNMVIEAAVTIGLPGLLLLGAFVVLVLLLSGWRSPLAGFGVLGLAMQLVQPQHAGLSPLIFLALGSAASAGLPLKPLVAAAWRGVLIGVAATAGAVIMVGSFALTVKNATISGQYGNLRLARRLLPMWYEPYLKTGIWDEEARPNDRAAQAHALQWYLVAAHRESGAFALWTVHGEAEQQFGDPHIAEADFRRALVDNRYSVRTLNDLGQLLIKDGNRPEGIALLKRSLLAMSDQPDIRKLVSTS